MIQIFVAICFVFQLLSNVQCRYEIIKDFEYTVTQSGWLDQNKLTFLKIEQDETSENWIGQVPRDTSINWTRQMDLPQTNKVYLYLEFQFFGNWSSDQLLIYANNVQVFGSFYSLKEQNSQSQLEKFTYNLQILIIINKELNTLKLQIQAQKHYLELHIKNVLIMHSTLSLSPLILLITGKANIISIYTTLQKPQQQILMLNITQVRLLKRNSVQERIQGLIEMLNLELKGDQNFCRDSIQSCSKTIQLVPGNELSRQINIIKNRLNKAIKSHSRPDLYNTYNTLDYLNRGRQQTNYSASC